MDMWDRMFRTQLQLFDTTSMEAERSFETTSKEADKLFETRSKEAEKLFDTSMEAEKLNDWIFYKKTVPTEAFVQID